jgi:dimethylsulfone monooxygenase
MFGIEQRGHADRYEHGDEWIRAIRALWSNGDDFDFESEFFHLKGVRAKPKPWGGTQPLVINAGASPAGQEFAVRNCDAYFTGVRMAEFDDRTGAMVPDLQRGAALMESVRSRAAAIGRQIGIFTRGEIFCRPSRAEAFEYYRYAVVDNADWGAVEGQLAIFGVKNDGSAEFEARKQHHVRGFPIIGDPDDVARMLQALSEAGFDGLAIGLVNYLDELPYLRETVLPRLERAGLHASDA